jgi:hypothetical protein
VKAAQGDRNAGLQELTPEIDRARELVGLDADQANQGLPPARRIFLTIRSGRTRVLVSS